MLISIIVSIVIRQVMDITLFEYWKCSTCQICVVVMWGNNATNLLEGNSNTYATKSPCRNCIFSTNHVLPVLALYFVAVYLYSLVLYMVALCVHGSLVITQELYFNNGRHQRYLNHCSHFQIDGVYGSCKLRVICYILLNCYAYPSLC